VSWRLRPGGLWRNPDFMKTWAGETVSFFGQQITYLALPLAAALTLHATAAQMGILGAARFAPFLLVSLFVGVWVDRRRRRPILITANIARALVLACIPLAAYLGALRIELLYAVGFLVGVFQVVFELAYQSFLPSLVGIKDLVEGNSKIVASWSAAEIGGPGLGGILVDLIGAPLALVSNTFSFLVSALTLGLIRKPEPAPAPAERELGLWLQMREGFRVVLGSPYLRALSWANATANMFSQVIMTVIVLYATRDLAMRAGMLGLIIATGSVGALIGSVGASQLAERIGIGRTIVVAMALTGGASFLLPVAAGPGLPSTLALIAGFFGIGIGGALMNVHTVTLRQAITPNRLLGRMNASYRFFIWGTMPIGSLLGGLLGDVVGLRTTLLIGALGTLLALAWVAFSPVPGLQRLPAAVDNARDP